MRWRILFLVGFVTAVGVFWAQQPTTAQEKKGEQKKKGEFKKKTWNEVVDLGAAYLKGSQGADGSWSKGTSPGISGLVLTGLFRTGRLSNADPVATLGLKFIEGMADEKEGHLAAGDKVRHVNYITSVNLLALKSAKADKKYSGLINGAANYLKKLQWDEGEDKTPKDPYYGGTGYGPGTRPDMSNSQFFIDALKAAGVPASDPAYQKAVVFVSRCQNLKSEFNDQPWASKINDGSFIYVLGTPKGGTPDDAPRPGNGSMTAAGYKSFVLCGLSREDSRVKKAAEWLTKNYSVDVNPGQAPGNGGRAYYYYLTTLAKCLDALGEDTFVDAQGGKHDWRAEITTALTNRQRKDGSWNNEIAGFQEANADLCTAYALLALSYTQPKAK